MAQAKFAFGSEVNVQDALDTGKISAYNLLLLDEKKIGWVDRDGNPIIAKGDQVKVVEELPEVGDEYVIYIYNHEGYLWDGEKYKHIFQDEEVVDGKIEASIEENKQYVDDAISDFENKLEQASQDSRDYTDNALTFIEF